MKTVKIMALVAALFASHNAQADAAHSEAKVTPLMRQPLPDYPGKEGVLITVEYAPGYVGGAHRHPGPLFIYVLQGSIEMQMARGELRGLRSGDTFYEDSKDVHGVGRNVSQTEPAKLLVFMVKDPNAPVVLPAQ